MAATVGQLMTATVIAIDHDATVEEAARKMRDERIGSLFVNKDGQSVGIVTETDVVRKAAAVGRDLHTTPVHELMSHPILSIDQQSSARYAVDIMSNAEIRHLAVTDNGTIVGLLSVRDILDYFKTVVPGDDKS